MINWQGPKRQPCPSCDHGPRDTACSVGIDPDDGRLKAHCFRCQGNFWPDEETRAAQRPRHQVQPDRHRGLSEFGLDLWRACRPLGGEALAYLRARCCVIPPTDGDLRWHPALRHPPTDYRGPALVARITDAVSGAALSLHRTWVLADGTKAPVQPARMLLGAHRKAGGVVRLWPDDTVTGGLAVAEGIESALGFAHLFKPVWAALDAGNLAALPVLRGVDSLVVAADHDEVGLAAASSCVRRWREAGVDSRSIRPDIPGWDFNDEAQRGSA